MKHYTITTIKKDTTPKLNTSNIYFEIKSIDTFSTKYINLEATDYTKLEKSYCKNVSLDIKYLTRNKQDNLDIGTLNLTYFDFDEALQDNIDIEEILDAEGPNTSNIYSVVIQNFNKSFYEFFNQDKKGSIINVTGLALHTDFTNEDVISYIFKIIPKAIYHILGLNISTILSSTKLINSIDLLKIYTMAGFLEVENEPEFVVKNVSEYKKEEHLTIDDKFAEKLRILIYNPNEVCKILQGSYAQSKSGTKKYLITKKGASKSS